MPDTLKGAILGFIAAVLAVLTFHQGMIQLLASLGLGQGAWFNTSPVPPFGVPRIVSLCFWGGLYGAVFGLMARRFTLPLWVCGLILGVIASLVGMFLVAWIRGAPIANNWMAGPIVRSLVINGAWGIGTGLFLSLLLPRAARRRPALG